MALHPPQPGEPGAPDTEERLDTLHASLANTIVGRDEYLRQIDGITFGEDPRQGFFEGATFYHPDMRFQLQFPEGWKTQNTPSAVVAVSPKEDAIIQLGLAGTHAAPRGGAASFSPSRACRPATRAPAASTATRRRRATSRPRPSRG